MSVVQQETNDHGDSSEVQVYLRFRPMNKLEISRRSRCCVKVHSPNEDEAQDENDLASVTVDSPLEGEFDFSFDKIFKEDTAQEEVYNSISPQAKRLVDGFNTAIVAFGQSGSGKTDTMMGDNPLQQQDEDGEVKRINYIRENTGIIPRISKEIFELLQKASPIIEFTVRVSFVEVYLEQVRDLLNPSKRFLKIDDGDEKSDYERRKGPKLQGLCEVCCLEWTEVVALLFRGNSFRVASEQRKQTDLNQSHSIFTIKIEQRNIVTERTVTSRMHLVDLAGSESKRRVQKARTSKSIASSSDQDKKGNVTNRSHMALDKVIGNLERYHDPRINGQGDRPRLPPNPDYIPYNESKLTRLLCNVLGGNCFTTFILTASTASFNITSTIATLRFGERCRRIKNYPYLNVEASPEECNIELEKSKKIQSELLVLIKEIGLEMKRIKDKGVMNPLQDEGPFWEKLNEICESNKYFVLEEQSTGGGTNTISISLHDELKQKENEIKELKAKLAEAREDRNNAQSRMLEMESECVFLRNESEVVLAAKKRNTEDIIDAQNEIQRLSQKKLELGHDLLTSRFRENEAIAFTRMFRRFYRLLLQNNTAHGTTSPNDLILRMAGVPNLDDLIDIDVLLCESGLIEDHEVNSSVDDKKYNPSVSAIVRSSALASKAKRQARLAKSRYTTIDVNSHTTGSRNTLSTKSGTFDDSMQSFSVIPGISPSASGQSATSSPDRLQFFSESPSGIMTDNRIDQLEKDLLHITRRCLDLQTALNESEEWVELLSMSKSKKKVIQENFDLKNELSKKESDMQALVWKMNEIHMINKAYNDKLLAGDRQITFLNDKLTQLQHKDMMQTYKQEDTERRLRSEIMRLNTLMDAMARIHWQDGRKGHKHRLESRIIIPFQGGSSLDPKTREALLRGGPRGITSIAGSRTTVGSDDGMTSAGISYAMSYGPSIASSIYIDKNQMSFNKRPSSSKTDDISYITGHLNSLEENKPTSNPESVAYPPLTGGKSGNFEPRRKLNKKALKIKPGILKVSPDFPMTQVDRQKSLSDAQKKIDDLKIFMD